MKTSVRCRRFSESGFRCVLSSEFEAGAIALGLDRAGGFERALAESTTTRGGRGDNRLLHAASWPGRVRLRPLRHGGVLGEWLGDRFLTPARSEREFHLWQALEASDAPIPRVALAISRRRGLFWRPMLGAMNRESALNGREWLESTDRDGATIASVARRVAGSIRRFHDAGALHGDLHLGNLLIQAADGHWNCSLVDLDRSVLRTAPTAAERMGELIRLMRSVEKAGRAEILRPRILSAFLAGYCRRDRVLRREILACGPRELQRLRRHRWGWKLARLASTAGLSLVLLACRDALPTSAARASEPIHRLSLLATGDTGRDDFLPSLFGGQIAVANAMVAEDRSDPVDGVVLLGDNFYWYGLERTHLVERIRRNLVGPYCHFLALTGPRSAEVEKSCRTPPASRHAVPFYAVLGNHDLESPESARLQRDVVPEFVPGWQMSRSLAEVVELGEGVSLILFESEISIRDRAAIERALIDALRTAQGPWRILATHRPIATDDVGRPPVGGYPAWVRSAIVESGRPVQLVLAGHHHNLQAFALQEPSALLQIGVGSGSHATPPLAEESTGSLFGAIELGFARVDLDGRGGQERLSVSIYGTPRWPWLASVEDTRRLARFEVDRAGSVIVTRADQP